MANQLVSKGDKMKKLLICFLLVCGCSVTGTIDISHTFPASEREEWCLEECGKYEYTDDILLQILKTGNESPQCICMKHCMLLDSTMDSTYCPKQPETPESTESSVHPLVGVWNQKESTFSNITTTLDEHMISTYIFYEDNTYNYASIDWNELGTWSTNDNKLTTIETGRNDGWVIIRDYSISGDILIMIEAGTYETKWKKQ